MGKNKEQNDLLDIIDPIDIDTPLDDAIYIDTDSLNKEAEDESKFMFKDLERVYSNEEFMSKHPEYKKRLDIELESLRYLLKMKKADEVTHDILVKQIGMTPNNASLYASLNRMQTSMLNIDTKLEQRVKAINQLLKNYQMELPFEKEEEETVNIQSNESKISAQTFRGTKAFMNYMTDKYKNNNTQNKYYIEEDENLPNQLDLFEDSEAIS